jgi:hypothetical protein
MTEQHPDAETTPSLRGYLQLYAAGFVDRDEMLTAVAAWSFIPEAELDEGHPEPTHQDNTLSVLSAARLLGHLTRADLEDIQHRLDS